MNKISFIIEFDEVSKTQEEQLTEFIEKTGIKFHVLESDNDLKKYKKYKEVIDKMNKLLQQEQDAMTTKFHYDIVGLINALLDILNEGKNE